MVRIKRGVSGYREDGSPYRYSVNSVITDRVEVEQALIKSGIAELYYDTSKRPIAIAPMVNSIKSVIKRARHV